MNTDPDYNDEVQKRWGHTAAFAESKERVNKLSKADLKRITTEGDAITQDAADLMAQGFAHGSTKVQRVMELHYKHLYNFYDPTYAMFKGLGQMYVEDPRFAAMYEKRAKGLAQFLCDAMGFYADAHKG